MGSGPSRGVIVRFPIIQKLLSGKYFRSVLRLVPSDGEFGQHATTKVRSGCKEPEMDRHVHGPLLDRFTMYLCDGPFAGNSIEVRGCCSAPWMFYVGQTPAGLRGWHPEEDDPGPVPVEYYIRNAATYHNGSAQAMHLSSGWGVRHDSPHLAGRK